MNIIHIATEFAPIVKVGGLADVVYSLCTYLSQKEALKISVLLPLYKSVITHKIGQNLCKYTSFLLQTPINSYSVIVWKTSFKKIILYFFEISPYFTQIYCDIEIE